VAPGYPEEIIVECIEPEDYPDNWSYGIWLKGRWTNLANVTKCIDPNVCYDSPPTPPSDFTVVWNQTTDKPNVVNTSLVYSCGTKCRNNFFSRNQTHIFRTLLKLDKTNFFTFVCIKNYKQQLY
jgi:hypothetical protein